MKPDDKIITIHPIMQKTEKPLPSKVIDITRIRKRIKDYTLAPENRRRAKKMLIILERDNFKCTKCNKPYNLTIDREYKEGIEYPSSNKPRHYDPKHCKTLCLDCHKIITIERRKQIRGNE